MMLGDRVVVLMERAARRLAPAGSDAAGVGVVVVLFGGASCRSAQCPTIATASLLQNATAVGGRRDRTGQALL